MDKPLSNLDATLCVSMRGELKRLQHELDATSVYVTHDQIEPTTLATRLAAMNKGELVQLGTPEAIGDDPASVLVAIFIGSPPMNLLHGRAKAGVLEGPGMRLDGLPPDLDGEVILGVHPEHMVAVEPGQGDLEGLVHAVECTNAALQIVASVDDDQVTALVDPHARAADQAIDLKLDRSRLFLFDPVNGQRIPWQPCEAAA